MSNEVIVMDDEITARLAESIELAIEDSIKTVIGVEDAGVVVTVSSDEIEENKLTGTFTVCWSDDQTEETDDEELADESMDDMDDMDD